MKTETYHTLEYHELDDLVNKYFPLSNFNVVADEELHNDSSRDFDLITKDAYSNWQEYDKKNFNQIILGKLGADGRTYMFLEFFVANDILPEGNYLVKVNW